MKHKVYSYILLSITFIFFSCEKETGIGDDDNSRKPIEIKATFEPMTRVSTIEESPGVLKSSFDDGDEIGVFAVMKKSDTTDSLHINNKVFRYNGTVWTVDGDVYYPSNGASLDFYAYYPYNASYTSSSNPLALPANLQFSVKDDQSSDIDFSKSDFLFPTVKEQKQGMVLLTFEHKMALIEVQITDNSTNSDLIVENDLTVSLTNVIINSTMQIADGSIAADGTIKVSVEMLYKSKNDNADGKPVYTYWALIPPQNISFNEELFTFVQSGEGQTFNYKYNINTDLVIDNGKHYVFNKIDIPSPTP